MRSFGCAFACSVLLATFVRFAPGSSAFPLLPCSPLLLPLLVEVWCALLLTPLLRTLSFAPFALLCSGFEFDSPAPSFLANNFFLVLVLFHVLLDSRVCVAQLHTDLASRTRTCGACTSSLAHHCLFGSVFNQFQSA